jgi:hypothetical protein
MILRRVAQEALTEGRLDRGQAWRRSWARPARAPVTISRNTFARPAAQTVPLERLRFGRPSIPAQRRRSSSSLRQGQRMARRVAQPLDDRLVVGDAVKDQTAFSICVAARLVKRSLKNRASPRWIALGRPWQTRRARSPHSPRRGRRVPRPSTEWPAALPRRPCSSKRASSSCSSGGRPRRVSTACSSNLVTRPLKAAPWGHLSRAPTGTDPLRT